MAGALLWRRRSEFISRFGRRPFEGAYMRENGSQLSLRLIPGIVALLMVLAADTSSVNAHRRVVTDSVSAKTTEATEIDQARVLNAYAKLPVAFVENRGQKDPRVRYYAQGHGYAFYLTRDQVVLGLAKDAATDVTLALGFVHHNESSAPEGQELASGEVPYLLGNDPAGWHTGLRRYSQIVYRELWPGIDLQLHEQSGRLKYEFRVRAGARPESIQLTYSGTEGLSLDASGTLLIKTAIGVLRDSAPVSYQEFAGVRMPVKSRYVLDHETGREAQFAIAVDSRYQPDHDLIIDPGVDYTTFLGGNSEDSGAGIAVDAAGNAYVVG